MPTETQIAVKAVDGSFASVAKSLTLVGTAAKAFVLAHPISLSLVGGTLLGLGLCCAFKKRRKNSTDSQQHPVAVNPTPTEAVSL